MDKPPSAETIAVWTRLIRAGSAVRSVVERSLKRAGLPPLEWYDVLQEIERAGDSGIRPADLMDAAELPQYSLSRLLGRMEKAGLVTRESIKGDRRGQIIHLTEDGRKTRAAMWPVYGQALQQTIGDRLDLGEALRVGQYLQRLAEPYDGIRG